MLATLGITREQLVDIAILVGNDFNGGIKGIGPKKALKLVREHGSIEQMPASIREALEPMVAQVRKLFLEPEVTDEYDLDTGGRDVDGVVQYLCGERAFSEERVRAALKRAFAT
jgi:flap endonuclease-1